MTITGTQNKILELLNNQDIISLGEIKLILRESLRDEKLLTSLILKSFEDLVRLDVVRVLEDGYWVLTKPLHSFTQTLTISGTLACSIAKVLNTAAQKVTENNETEFCNALAITEEDIETITVIANNVNEQDDKLDGEDDIEDSDEFKLPN